MPNLQLSLPLLLLLQQHHLLLFQQHLLLLPLMLLPLPLPLLLLLSLSLLLPLLSLLLLLSSLRNGPNTSEHFRNSAIKLQPFFLTLLLSLLAHKDTPVWVCAQWMGMCLCMEEKEEREKRENGVREGSHLG